MNENLPCFGEKSPSELSDRSLENGNNAIKNRSIYRSRRGHREIIRNTRKVLRHCRSHILGKQQPMKMWEGRGERERGEREGEKKKDHVTQRNQILYVFKSDDRGEARFIVGNRYETEQILHTITLLVVSEQVSDPGKIGFINTRIISNMHKNLDCNQRWDQV